MEKHKTPKLKCDYLDMAKTTYATETKQILYKMVAATAYCHVNIATLSLLYHLMKSCDFIGQKPSRVRVPGCTVTLSVNIYTEQSKN